MHYFHDTYPHVRFPIAENATSGLRNAQIGGLFAVTSHFTVNRDPALVVMPTGTGKTAVLMLTPFLRRATRALVVTPSKLVRDQVAGHFKTLAVLKGIGVLPPNVSLPKVLEQKKRVKSEDDWKAMAEYDVVVATPNGISPDYEGIPNPPPDLFDILLIDEAHHSPARTWTAILKCFPRAAQALFTATPYRLDSREIKARAVYTYPIRSAYQDGVFGKVRFCPVEPKQGDSADLALAKAAELQFEADKAAGLRHRILVRTATVKRAKELLDFYRIHTKLRLELVTGRHSRRHVKQVLDGLQEDTLDGLVCVDMMSEGFDFPWLKIAVLHAPHRSLAVTLQFIGRFARTNAPNISEAKFLAVPGEVKGEVERLYNENAVWQELIVDLQQKRIDHEADVREGIESFAPPIVATTALQDLSLYSLWPYAHVKVYRVAVDDVKITTEIRLPEPFRRVYHRASEELSTAVIIANERQQPRWCDLDAFTRSEYDLFVVYYDRKTKLLFINASQKSDLLYEEIARQYTLGRHKILPRFEIDRVRHGIANTEFFNVGMKNRVAYSSAESYRIISGRRADQAVTKSDGRLYHRGHVFGKGVENGNRVTIGYSSASKIWSNKNLQIPKLSAWCRAVADRLSQTGPLPSHTGLDFLPVGEKLTQIPEGLLSAQWPASVYDHHTDFRYRVKHSDTPNNLPITESDLTIDRAATNGSSITFSVCVDQFAYPIRFLVGSARHFEPIDLSLPEPAIVVRGEETPLLAFLNNDPATFLFADYSTVCGDEHVSYSKTDYQPMDERFIEVVDWTAANVDIEKEFEKKPGTPSGRRSIHTYLWERLNTDTFSAVIYDHRSGEAADYIALSQRNGKVAVGFYHCKGSGGPKPGDRVEDVYEVCGQAIKSLMLVQREDDLLGHIRYRTESGSRFVRGDMTVVRREFDYGRQHGFDYQVFMVQPGVTKGGLTQKIGEVLAASRDYLARSGVSDTWLLASA